LQEVGLQLLLQPDSAIPRDRFAAWLKSVARHIVLHKLRAQRYERAKLAALDTVSHVDPWASDRDERVRSSLACELEQMDRPSREILLRRYVLGQTSHEIASEMNLSAAAVRMRLMRIRGELSARNRDNDVNEEPPSAARNREGAKRALGLADGPSAEKCGHDCRRSVYRRSA
jgi:RNA polymerase sigma factor (sigma-70 family)